VRPALVLWLQAHGIAGWLAPDYLVLAGIGSLCAGIVSLHLAPREWRATYARALFAAYLCTFIGGHLFEALRHIPEAIHTGDVSLVSNAGKAAWGGLLGAILGGYLVVRHARAPLGPFFDAVAVGVGIVFAFVRVGCFLGGCDFGVPTAGPLGVRFPEGSLAAIAHVHSGWVASGQPSLPVHPTQLYEAAFGALSAGVVFTLARRGLLQGQRFFAWILAYSVFRFANEMLRGDGDRGIYAGLSSAQLVSISVTLAVLARLSAVRAHSAQDLPAPARAASPGCPAPDAKAESQASS
jgi:phosphatidylglycerol:prolipoprotein diacylglycerol transferase